MLGGGQLVGGDDALELAGVGAGRGGGELKPGVLPGGGHRTQPVPRGLTVQNPADPDGYDPSTAVSTASLAVIAATSSASVGTPCSRSRVASSICRGVAFTEHEYSST